MSGKGMSGLPENPVKITAVHLYERKRVVWLSQKHNGAPVIQSYDKWRGKNFPFSADSKDLSYATMERLHHIYKDMHSALKNGQDPAQKLYTHYRPFTVKTDTDSLDVTRAVEITVGGAVFTKIPCRTATQKQLDVCFAGRKKPVLALLNDLKKETGTEYDLTAQARIAARKENEAALSRAIGQLQKHRQKSLKALGKKSSYFTRLAEKAKKLPARFKNPAPSKISRRP